MIVITIFIFSLSGIIASTVLIQKSSSKLTVEISELLESANEIE